MNYCEFASKREEGDLHRIYHDTVYGFPLENDNSIFGRLILEINQAGLSWSTILAKEKNFFKAYHGFKIKRIASYRIQDRNRLLSDVGIIRNRLKVDAAIYNAQVILSLQKQKEFGSFKNWLDHHHQLIKNMDNPLENWTKLFRKNFKFTGGEIVNEFLKSIGYLPGAHIPECPIYKKVLSTHPPWKNNNSLIG